MDFRKNSTVRFYLVEKRDAAYQRLGDVLYYENAEYVDSRLLQILQRWAIGYLIVRQDSPLEPQIRTCRRCSSQSRRRCEGRSTASTILFRSCQSLRPTRCLPVVTLLVRFRPIGTSSALATKTPVFWQCWAWRCPPCLWAAPACRVSLEAGHRLAA